MSYKYTREELIDMCNSIGLIFVDRFIQNGRTTLKVKCTNHPNKGELILSQERTERWVRLGRCCCALTFRDTDDLKSEPSIDKDVVIIGEYQKSNIKTLCRCIQCGKEFYCTPNKLKRGNSCPYCKPHKVAKRLRKTQAQFEKDVASNNCDIIVKSEYLGATKPITIECCKCHKISIIKQAQQLSSGEQGCPYCSKSLGERLIAEALDCNGIAYEREFQIPFKQKGHPLRFDFYLPTYNTFIEYQGEQHYHPVDFKGSKDGSDLIAFQQLNQRDDYKRKYCSDNHYQLIEIPYYEKQNIDNIIHEITQNATVETVIPGQ